MAERCSISPAEIDQITEQVSSGILISFIKPSLNRHSRNQLTTKYTKNAQRKPEYYEESMKTGKKYVKFLLSWSPYNVFFSLVFVPPLCALW